MRIYFSKIIDWLLVVFLFLLPWQTRWIWYRAEINGAYWEYGSYSIYGTEILLWLIVILFAINRFSNRELWKKITSRVHYQAHKKNLWAAIGFVTFLVIELFLSKQFSLSYNYIFNLLGAICIFLVISEMGNIKHFWALWAGGVLQGLLAVWQFLTQYVYSSKWLGIASQDPHNLGVSVVEFGNERWLRAYGSFGWPNSLGIYLAILLILGVILYLKTQKPLNKILISIGQVIIAAGLVLSFSRSAWLASLIGLGLCAVFFVRKINILEFIKQLFFILVPAVILFFVFQPLFTTRFTVDNRLETKSLTERSMQVGEFANIFSKNMWWGVGPGAYTLALAEELPKAKSWELQPVHNIYLLTLAEWGILGSLVWLVVYSYIFSRIWKINRKMLTVVAVILIVGMFDHWNYTLYTGMLLWWVAWSLDSVKI